MIKYRAKDTTGLGEDDVDCGLVGSVTFCLFSYKMAQRPPEDAYAIHCCWEMEAQRLIRKVELKQGDTEHNSMLQQWHGEPLKNPEIVGMMELSPRLKYPQKVVAVATAVLKGMDGWVVLDGERSAWYPKQDMPDQTHQDNVVRIHVGRTLLGFKSQPDRQKYLVKVHTKRDPQQIIQAYEKLLTEVTTGDEKRKKSLLGMGSPLKKHFDAYVEAQATVKGRVEGRSHDPHLRGMAGRSRRSGGEALRKEAMDSFGPLGGCFEQYVDCANSHRPIRKGRVRDRAILPALGP